MKVKIGSNRNFGIVFSIFFFLIAFWPLLNDGSYRLWSIFIAFIFFVLGLVNSKLLMPLNILWFKFGILLGKIVSPFVMCVIFFFVVTPIAILMKIFKKDLLNLRFNNTETYWIKKDEYKSKMKNQF